MSGWVSPALPKLISNDTPLTSGSISTEQVNKKETMNKKIRLINYKIFY